MPVKLLDAAQRLGCDIKTLHKRMEKLGITPQASQEDKRGKVITEADFVKLGGKIEGQDRIVGISKEMPASVPTMALEGLESFPLSHDSIPLDEAQNRILERFERIESKIDALTALLERAAIAPRYIARQSVDEALDEMRPKRAYTKHQNKPMRAAGMRLALFAGLHGVNERTARDQVKVQEAYQVTIVPTNSHQEYYVEEHQKAAIIAYWKRTGYPYSPCPDCPHEKQEPLESL